MSAPRTTSGRPHGLLILIAVVGVGMLASIGLLRWGWTRVEAADERLHALREAAPKDPMVRVDKWLLYSEPQIQNRLAKLRFSSLHPGLITHRVVRTDGPAEIWGVDLSGAHPARIEREGLVVTVVLPEPRLLGHGELSGMNADLVPDYQADSKIPDPKERAQLLCEHFLGGLREAFEKDIEGAQLLFRFEGQGAAAPATGDERG
ncbi:MAG: hypothetical protein KDC14_04480 [Planctomycetes bacterium]|nr:hypothetical protein [Planctomycetota bacterium]